MAIVGRWVVRIVTNSVGHFDLACEKSSLIDILQFAGAIKVLRSFNENGEGMCFDILPPRQMADNDTKNWAERLLAYINLEPGEVNAVVVPELIDE